MNYLDGLWAQRTFATPLATLHSSRIRWLRVVETYSWASEVQLKLTLKEVDSMSWVQHGCFYFGVLVIGDLLFWVHPGAPVFSKLPHP